MPTTTLSRRAFACNAALAGAAALTTASLAGSAAAEAAVDPAAISWDKEVDVLVVGSGACGMAAALECARNGLTVTVVDRNDELGGCAMLAGGICGWSAPYTREGIANDMTVEGAYAAFTDPANPTNRRNDPEICRAYVENVAEVVDMLTEAGVDMQGMTGSEYTGGAAFPAYPENPGPSQFHHFLGEGVDCSGSGVIRPLEKALIEAGGELLQRHTLVHLIHEDGGAVLGGEVDADGTPTHIKASKAVVLGAGGWKGNPALRKAFDPRIPEDIPYTGYPYAVSDGSAIVEAFRNGAMFASDGGALDQALFQVKFGTPWYGFNENSGIAAPGMDVISTQAASYIFVNMEGKRFYDESLGAQTSAYAEAIMPLSDHNAWMVYDANGAETCGFDIHGPACDPELVFEADSLEELAALMGMDPDALVATVDEYNGFVDAGEDTLTGKDAKYLTEKIGEAPFYGVHMQLLVHDSCGGVRINGNCQVLDLYGEPIPALYAGGDAVGGISLLGLPRALTTGYIAGKHIVQNA